MATPNVALAEKIIEAINARDAGALLAIADDDIEVVPLRAALEWTTYRGEDGVIRLMHDLAETWDELHFELEEAREVRPGSVLGLA
ncbi:MAG TPA: hypothetical protein VE570_03615, partial [Thermoleophilaceae bacterium]|nr:hypothetical protein [Thermoleophilaceae bacterium]